MATSWFDRVSRSQQIQIPQLLGPSHLVRFAAAASEDPQKGILIDFKRKQKVAIRLIEPAPILLLDRPPGEEALFFFDLDFLGKYLQLVKGYILSRLTPIE